MDKKLSKSSIRRCYIKYLHAEYNAFFTVNNNITREIETNVSKNIGFSLS